MTYRSPQDALHERTLALEGELQKLREQRLDAIELEAEIARVAGELQKSRSLLDRLEKKRPLPMLDEVRIASPCSARWDDMVGDEKVRFCGACRKNVWNLSAMRRDEAEVLMLETEGDPCVRLYRRKDGTVLTSDCPVGEARKRLRLVGVLALGGSAAFAAAGLAAASLATEMGAPRPVPVVVPSATQAPTATMGAPTFDADDVVPVPVEKVERVEMGKRVLPRNAPKPK